MKPMTRQYTPGPWFVSYLDSDGVVIKQSGFEITTPAYDVCANLCNGAPIRREEDARLIAASPQMLAALIEARSVLINAIGALHRHGLEVPMQWFATEVDIRQAIAKAEGVAHET